MCSERSGFVNAIRIAKTLLGIFLFPWNWFIQNVIWCLFKCYHGSRLTGIHSLYPKLRISSYCFGSSGPDVRASSNTFRHVQTTYKYHSDERADRAALLNENPAARGRASCFDSAALNLRFSSWSLALCGTNQSRCCDAHDPPASSPSFPLQHAHAHAKLTMLYFFCFSWPRRARLLCCSAPVRAEGRFRQSLSVMIGETNRVGASCWDTSTAAAEERNTLFSVLRTSAEFGCSQHCKSSTVAVWGTQVSGLCQQLLPFVCFSFIFYYTNRFHLHKHAWPAVLLWWSPDAVA